MRLGTTSLSVTRLGSKRRPVAAGPAATYALSSAGSVNEGENMVVTVTTTNVTDSTVLYWSTSNITTSDPDFTATSGTTTITNNSGSFSVTAVADSTTEGAETFGITLRSGSQSGPIVASTTNKTINDTSQSPPPPSYSASSASSINEGSALGVTVTTTNVSDGTTLYWTTNHTTTSAADFSSNSGSFTINSNSGTFNVPVVSDSTTEGSETFTVEIRTTSTSGAIVATLPSVTVNDTSIATSYTISTASTEVDEGSSLVCTVTTTGVSDGSTRYWSINHITTNSSDFTSTSGSFTINNNSATFSISAANDTNNESDETFSVQIRSVSVIGPVLDTSNTITLNNIFFDDAANYSYVRNSAINTGTNSVYACAISPDGTNFYTVSATRQLKQQSLSTPYDISSYGSATTVTLDATNFQNPLSLVFKPDGTKLFIANGASSKVSICSLSTAWDISTLSYDTEFNFEVPTAYTGQAQDFIFSHDGTKCFVLDAGTEKIVRFDLNTAWDITSGFSATSNSGLLYPGGINEPLSRGMAFSNDGKKVYITGFSTDTLHSYNLTTAYDITGVSGAADSTLNFLAYEATVSCLRFSANGKYFYIGGNAGDDFTQFQR